MEQTDEASAPSTTEITETFGSIMAVSIKWMGVE
jgi:hypothetical protein